MTKQVDKSHYDFGRYVDIDRWASYYQQIKECVELKPTKVLVVGVGDEIVVHILRQLLPNNATVQTLDFDADLKPDFCGSIANLDSVIPVTENFDVIICCQVLEHLPFSEFDNIVKQMCQKAKHLIISLPYRSLRMKISLLFYKFKEKSWCVRMPLFWQKFDIKKQGRGEHYWEIGCRGTQLKEVSKVIEHYGKIEKSYYIPQNLYHHFFVVTPKK